MNKRSLLLRATTLAAMAFLGTGMAHAADPVFPPHKPVTLVVGFAAGGAADAAARLIAKKLGENIGQSVVVDNRGGAVATSLTSRWPRAWVMDRCCFSGRSAR